MRLIIASDLHGSAYYTERLVSLFKAVKPEKMILLGDILYHGPRNDLPRDYSPKKVADLLNELSLNILAIRGNCDSEVDSMMLEFNIMSEYGMLIDGDQVMYLSHGHKDVVPMPQGSYSIFGHTHVPTDYSKDGIRYRNPGSVSIPKENSPNSCILYDGGIFNWISLRSFTPFDV